MNTPQGPQRPELRQGTPTYPPGYSPAYPPQPPRHGAQWPPPYDQPNPEFDPKAGKTDGLAVISLVAGLLALTGLGSIIAIVTGHVAMGRTKRSGRPGHGMALAGTILGYIGLAGVIVFVAAAAGSGNPSPARAVRPAVSASTAAPAAPAAPAATVPPVRPVVRVRFIVTGNGAPSITYGSSSDNRSPRGGLGILGDGVQLPFTASMRFRPDAEYYSMNAQLETQGNITCKIVVTSPGYAPLTVSSGHAQGQSNICFAQAAPDGTDSNGLPEWQNES